MLSRVTPESGSRSRNPQTAPVASPLPAVSLAFNENPRGPSPRVVAALSAMAPRLNRYPDSAGTDLRAAIGRHWGVLSEQIVLGNGSDDIVGMLARAFLAPGDETVMADDTFVVYKMETLWSRGVPIEIPLENGRHSLPDFVGALTPRTKLLFVCNPNNPTGTIVDDAEVDALMSGVPQDVVVVFDEAYYEYVCNANFPDTLKWLKQNRRVVILRTFSKMYGLAGLRIGYALTTPTIASQLNRVRLPFNVNAFAQHAALAALGDQDYVAECRTLNRCERGVLESGLHALGIRPLPSEANFLCFDVPKDGREVYEDLLRQGVLVRHVRGSTLRVTVGLPAENRLFLRVLAQTLA